MTSPVADFLYKCTDLYSPADERTLAWNDPSLGIEWPLPAGVAPTSVGQGRTRQELCRHREISLRVLVLGAAGRWGPRSRRRRPAVTNLSPRLARTSISATGALSREYWRRGPIGSSMRPPTRRWISPRNESPKRIAVNDTAVGVLAQAAARSGCRLLHLSTDFVFDGRSARAYLPDDPTHPLNAYGVSKLGGERQAARAAATAIVLRTSWVYAAAGRNFALTMLKLMREREQVDVVCDQIGTPTWATSLARAIWGLIEVRCAGGHLSLGGSRRGELVRLRGRDSGGGARARACLRARRAIVPDRDRRLSDPGACARPSACSIPRRRARCGESPALHWRHNLRMMLDELRAA